MKRSGAKGGGFGEILGWIRNPSTHGTTGRTPASATTSANSAPSRPRLFFFSTHDTRTGSRRTLLFPLARGEAFAILIRMSHRKYLLVVAALGLGIVGGCAAKRSETTVVRTETTTTTVRGTDPTPVAPQPNTLQCYALIHETPLIRAAPQRHLALVPRTSDILPDDVFVASLPAGTRLQLIEVKEFEGQGGAQARFSFARIETGPYAGQTVATDRVGLNYRGTVTADHVQAVPCP